jgi:predicted transcriptional regulator
MAMTLRLTPEETEQLRRYARRRGRSMQDVAREAIVTMTAEPPADRTISTFDFGEPLAHRVREVLSEGFGER